MGGEEQDDILPFLQFRFGRIVQKNPEVLELTPCLLLAETDCRKLLHEGRVELD
jgi:hypothetical protein